jgi:hypothetical protein
MEETYINDNGRRNKPKEINKKEESMHRSKENMREKTN